MKKYYRIAIFAMFVSVALFTLGGGCGGGGTVRKVSVTTPVDGGGEITIAYKLVIKASESASVNVKYSTDGTTWTSCTQGSGGSATSGLDKGDLTFVWDSVADIIGTQNVAVRITPVVDAREYKAGTTSVFQVSNVATPEAILTSPVTTQDGDVTIAYSLKGSIGTPLDIEVGISTDGVIYTACTPAPGGDGITGLFASYYGVEHTFVWNSLTDIPGQENQVYLRISPLSAGATNGTTIPFMVNNTPNAGSEPAVALISPSVDQEGNVLLSYSLTDTQSNDCSIIVQFSTSGNAGTFTDCARGFGGDGIELLASSPTGNNHTFGWNTLSAIGGIGIENQAVYVRISASDGTLSSAWDTTLAFNVTNDWYTEQDLLDLGAQSIQNNGIIAAQSMYETVQSLAGVDTQEYNEATFYVDGLGIPTSLTIDQNGPNPDTVDSFKEVLDGFGVSQSGRDFSNFNPTMPQDNMGDIIIPVDAPSPGQTFKIVTDDVGGPMQTFAQTTQGFDNDFTLQTPFELDNTSPMAQMITMDHADLLLISGGMHFFLHQLKWIQSYNFDMPFDAFDEGPGSYYDFRQTYPDMGTLDDPEKLEEARQHMISFMTNAIDAMTWLLDNTNRMPGEEGHLFVVYEADKEMIKAQLDLIKALRNSVANGETTFDLIDLMGLDNVSGLTAFGVTINMKNFYTANWSALMPPSDSILKEPLVEHLPTPIFNGIFPAYDTAAKFVHDTGAGIVRDVVNRTPVIGGANWPSPIYRDFVGEISFEGPVHLIEIEGTADFGYRTPGMDVSNVYVCHDADYLYVRIDTVAPIAPDDNTSYWLEVGIGDTWHFDNSDGFWANARVGYDSGSSLWYFDIYGLSGWTSGNAADFHVGPSGAGTTVQCRIPLSEVYGSSLMGEYVDIEVDWEAEYWDSDEGDFEWEGEQWPYFYGLFR